MRLYLLLILSIVVAAGCKKSGSANCNDLREKMVNDDFPSVKTIINRYIDGLPSKKYTAENLNRLASAISSQCDIDVEVICFDCIDTLPGQSEINIAFNSTFHKILDISTDSNNDMKILNMHN